MLPEAAANLLSHLWIRKVFRAPFTPGGARRQNSERREKHEQCQAKSQSGRVALHPVVAPIGSRHASSVPAADFWPSSAGFVALQIRHHSARHEQFRQSGKRQVSKHHRRKSRCGAHRGRNKGVPLASLKKRD